MRRSRRSLEVSFQWFGQSQKVHHTSIGRHVFLTNEPDTSDVFENRQRRTTRFPLATCFSGYHATWWSGERFSVDRTICTKRSPCFGIAVERWKTGCFWIRWVGLRGRSFDQGSRRTRAGYKKDRVGCNKLDRTRNFKRKAINCARQCHRLVKIITGFYFRDLKNCFFFIFARKLSKTTTKKMFRDGPYIAIKISRQSVLVLF